MLVPQENADLRPRFYTVREVAEMLRTSSMTIYRAIRDDQFPAVKVRGRLVVPAGIVEQMHDTALAGHTTVNPADYVQR